MTWKLRNAVQKNAASITTANGKTHVAATRTTGLHPSARRPSIEMIPLHVLGSARLARAPPTPGSELNSGEVHRQQGHTERVPLQIPAEGTAITINDVTPK